MSAHSATLLVLPWIISSLSFVLSSTWSCFLILRIADCYSVVYVKSPSAIGEDADNHCLSYWSKNTFYWKSSDMIRIPSESKTMPQFSYIQTVNVANLCVFQQSTLWTEECPVFEYTFYLIWDMQCCFAVILRISTPCNWKGAYNTCEFTLISINLPNLCINNWINAW